VVDQFVEVRAGEQAQGAPVRQNPVGIRQPLEDRHKQLVAEVAVEVGEILRGDEGSAPVVEDLAEVVIEHLADQLGRGDVGAKHPAVVDAALAVPILQRAVAPGAVGDADRGQVQDNGGGLGVDADFLAEECADRAQVELKVAHPRCRLPAEECPHARRVFADP